MGLALASSVAPLQRRVAASKAQETESESVTLKRLGFTPVVAFFPLNHFPPSGSVDLLEFAYDASGIEGLGAAMLREDGNGEMVCYFIEHAWTDFEKRYHINVKEGLAGYAALTSFYPIAPHRHALAHGDNTTETTTSTTNKSRSALQSVVLQHRADFAIQTGVVTRIRRVTSKDNVLSAQHVRRRGTVKHRP